MKGIKKKWKIIFGGSSMFFLIMLVTIIAILLSFFGAFISPVRSQDSTSTLEMREELLEQYEEMAESFEKESGVLVPIGYIFAMDGTIRFEHNFLDPDEIYITNDDMYCMTKEVDGILIFNDNVDEISSCKSFNEDEKNIFNYYLMLYEQIGGSDAEVDTGGPIIVPEGEEGFLKPVNSGVVTNEFHGWDALGQSDGHTGIDLAGGSTTIYPTAPGQVINVFSDSVGGNQVTILHHVDGKNYVSNYAHLKSSDVKIGDTVDYNTKIGTMGATGVVTGVHLHFEIIEGKEYIHSELENPRSYVEFPPMGEYFYERE